MKQILIDGNNLIGKLKSTKSLQKKDKQGSREKLVFVLDRHFADKKQNVTLHLDGFPGGTLSSSKMKIVYSNNKTADDKIRDQISRSKNPKLMTLVSSDFALAQFAKKCSCEIIKSEVFTKKLESANSKSEEEITRSISNEEMLRLFEVS
ncbi:MAG: NYN domain-containing protein [Melioribacteraceae bacterium]|nr:NYN domain-containing protein [Melioribacteraceae bacterium]MCF8263983.1 NYN domain-containing protein [Melioribacteraceae bacterium]MCF8430740.1 NYN domain-containing protein [Melioribacteraceae bacterium]